MNLKQPLLSGDDECFVFDCPTCGRSTMNDSDTFSIQGGAHLTVDPEKGRPSGRLGGYLMTVIRQERGSDVHNTTNMIVENVGAGQFNIFWCSLTCMRKYLNQLVDQLEQQMVE